MAKVSEAQRKHFVNRITTKMNSVIGDLRQQNASKVTKEAESKFVEYCEQIDVLKDLEALKELEAQKDEITPRLIATAEEIHKILQDNGHVDQFSSVHVWKGDAYDAFERKFKEFCNITCSKHNKGSISKEISKLESKRDEAIDFLYGLSEESELMHGVSKILEGTNVKLIG
tara:strand:- start:17529 stop:18044 length:516 start_codon:yes stop_codon:yes gene_type:complete